MVEDAGGDIQEPNQRTRLADRNLFVRQNLVADICGEITSQREVQQQNRFRSKPIGAIRVELSGRERERAPAFEHANVAFAPFAPDLQSAARLTSSHKLDRKDRKDGKKMMFN